MGLDMYLRAEFYASAFDHNSNEDKKKFASVLDALGLKSEDATPDTPSLHVAVTVGYWRKANAIHGWFVNNVQDGEDNCQPHSLSRDKIEELLNTCKDVLADHGKAAESLPTRGGFFFGPTDYDEGYFQDLEDTVVILDRVLKNPKFDRAEFIYQSSW